MDYKKFAIKYAAEINGDFREYDENQSVIVIQLPDERYQAVQGRVFVHEKYNRETIQLKSNVCKAEDASDFKGILEASANYVHSKFVMEDGYLRVESSAFMDSVTEARIKEMIQETGNLADEWEFNITGKDIY